MLTFVLIGWSAGFVLGLRFKTLVLLPAALLVALIAIGMTVVRAEQVWFTFVTAGAAISSLQFGYVAGAALAYYLAAGRIAQMPAAPLAAPPTVRRVH